MLQYGSIDDYQILAIWFVLKLKIHGHEATRFFQALGQHLHLNTTGSYAPQSKWKDVFFLIMSSTV